MPYHLSTDWYLWESCNPSFNSLDMYHFYYAYEYSKTCVKLPPSKRPKNGFHDRFLLNAGQKHCRMLQGEHSAILSTFIKLPFVIKIFVLSIFEWPFYTAFTVHRSNICCRNMIFKGKINVSWNRSIGVVCNCCNIGANVCAYSVQVFVVTHLLV